MAKTVEDLEARITKRARQDVDEAIKRFKKAVRAAVDQLNKDCGNPLSYPHIEATYTSAEALRVLMPLMGQAGPAGNANGVSNIEHWPPELWTARENAIREELLSTMDAMQKVLLAKDPGPDAAKPEPETPPATAAVA